MIWRNSVNLELVMNVQNLVEKIENGALGHVVKSVNLGHVAAFRDMMQLQLLNKVEVERVKIGDCFRVRGLGVFREFGLNLSWKNGVVFKLKNGLKPSEWSEIEQQIVGIIS